jgi:hypothetical protein
MTILVAVETLLLVLLSLVVVALLRSHAEILRRLGPPQEAGRDSDVLAPGLPDPPSREGLRHAPKISGMTLSGDVVQVGSGSGRPMLLAFLSSGCLTCEGFWETFSQAEPPAIPGGARVVAVTKDASHESPSRLRELAGDALEVVMSSAAWRELDVPTSPYFVYVGPDGMILGEGAAASWPQVASLLRDAIGDAEEAANLTVSRAGGSERARRVDEELAAAGIGPGDPSLYPAEGGSREGQ